MINCLCLALPPRSLGFDTPRLVTLPASGAATVAFVRYLYSTISGARVPEPILASRSRSTHLNSPHGSLATFLRFPQASSPEFPPARHMGVLAIASVCSSLKLPSLRCPHSPPARTLRLLPVAGNNFVSPSASRRAIWLLLLPAIRSWGRMSCARYLRDITPSAVSDRNVWTTTAPRTMTWSSAPTCRT